MTTGRIPVTSSELGTLWIVYQKKTMMVQVTDYFLKNSQEPKAAEILQTFNDEEKKLVQELKGIFKAEGATVPIGFTENDVNYNAPPLYDDIFQIIYLRMMMKIATGIHALHLSMSYRKDIMDLYRRFSAFAEDLCEQTTQYLLSKGALPKSPSVNMPNHAEIAEGKDYRQGFKLKGPKRTLNTVEVAYLYQAIEANVTGMKLMTGFSQVAEKKDTRNYFFKGKELSKSINSKFSEILLESDIIVPATSAGLVTESTISPFSDKLMMYNTSILNSFGLGSNALGTSFSLRKDLPLKMVTTAKDIFEFANEGGDLMAKHGWLEEPPQMEDRTRLSKGK
ncbi:DUF3231 family protein [Halobacillus naozhouensis]|uniref:DUF3231 family protein n=1 Tax=Halobacillus naozhouensis TaxID=554880 RepID=A0ABY8J182_9BACI|nr:DUF3231 family protein [Halobacillus naozhouensis]WFT76263.1 DUF3231 family protein [Halobacillus naozhouensis]